MSSPGSHGLRTVEQVIEQLRRMGKQVRKQGAGWMAQCPAHDDQHASLSVWEGPRGEPRLKCHANCDRRDVWRALGMEAAQGSGLGVQGEGWQKANPEPCALHPEPATYDYTDAAGTLRYRVKRAANKRFWVEHPTPEGGWEAKLGEAEWLLYRLPEVIGAAAGSLLFVVEGEKDVESLRARGLLATTNPGGAGKWRDAFSPALAGKRVVVLPDNDEPGQRHGEQVLASLRAAGVTAARLDLPGLPPKGDVSDWLAAGGTPERLIEMAEAAVKAAPSSGLRAQGGAGQPAHPEPCTLSPALSALSAPFAETRSWPAPLEEAAFHGIAGELVRAIEPHTEADPAALLVTLLAAVGNLIGRGPHARVEATRHGLNLFVAIVGPSAKARKGTSEDHIRAILREVEAEWEAYRVLSGSSTGEGLIKQVRDPTVVEETDPTTGKLRQVVKDGGVADKRLLLIESELAVILKVMTRKENTLSPVLRLAWDGKTLNTLTRGEPQRATGAHVSLVGHIVKDELRKHLSEMESANGFGNRFLWVCARRSKKLPFGGGVPELSGLIERLRAVVQVARGLGWIGWTGPAAALWIGAYDTLSEARPGLAGAVTGRAEAQVLRLAALYAVLDGRDQIDHDHLGAALAVWQYCEASADYIFVHGDRLQQRLLELLHDAPRGLTRNELRDHLQRHVPANRLEEALTALETGGQVCREKRFDTGGRAAEVWFLAAPRAESAESEESAAEPVAETETPHAVCDTVDLAELALDEMPEPPRSRWGGV